MIKVVSDEVICHFHTEDIKNHEKYMRHDQVILPQKHIT